MPKAICFVRLYGAHRLVSKMYLLVPLDSGPALSPAPRQPFTYKMSLPSD